VPRASALIGSALLAAACGCSPVYVLQSAAGHVDLLWRRRSISQALQDPGTPPELRAKLETADSARRFAFEKLGLKRSRSFSSWSPIDRDAATYLVLGSPRTKLEPYEWSFPLVGSFPYKGFFKRSRAEAERDRLEKRGFDAVVDRAIAYATPLPFADPLPSPALSLSTGSLAAVLIHELAHGTVNFKDHSDFDESMAVFVGEQGALRYLSERFGPASPELSAYRAELDRDAAGDAVFARLKAGLTALYSGPGSDAEKLEARGPLFAAAAAELRILGFKERPLNNADVVAHELYHVELPFADLLAHCGGDFPVFIAALKSLDEKDPSGELRRLAGVSGIMPPR
jgi:predicted aminopeptidase